MKYTKSSNSTTFLALKILNIKKFALLAIICTGIKYKRYLAESSNSGKKDFSDIKLP